MEKEASREERTILDELNEDFMGRPGDVLQKKITYWIRAFQSTVGHDARYYHQDDPDLWLFSEGVAMRIKNVKSEGIENNGRLTIFAISKIADCIEVELKDYSPRFPNVSTESKIILKFRINGSDVPVEIKATYRDCPRLAKIVALICASLS